MATIPDTLISSSQGDTLVKTTPVKGTQTTHHATASGSSVSNPPLAIQPAIPYSIEDKPTWTSSWRKGQKNPAGFMQDTDKGYDIISMRNDERHKLAMNYANGVLSDNFKKLPFFVTDINIDWALAGQTAQARLTRDMYPHNFVQPSFVVKGVSLNQEDYGEMCEYIHQAQHDALSGGQLIQLNVIPGKLWPRNGWGRAGGRGVRLGNSKLLDSVNAVNQIMRGPHKNIVAQGYVGTMQRKHTKGVYIPTWEMAFIVAAMLDGPYSEDLVTAKQQQNWVDVVKSVGIFQTSWYVQNDKQNLDWVKQNAPNIFYTPHVDLTHVSTGGGGGSGGSGSSGSSGSGTGNWWKVHASQEASSSGNGWTELSSNGNGAAAAGRTQSPNCQGNSVGACDFATLGKAYPHGTRLRILNPANGKSGIFPLTDIGNGSSFAPAIGLTPACATALGWTSGDVHIQLADGSDMNVVSGFGTRVSGPGGSSSSGGHLSTTPMTSRQLNGHPPPHDDISKIIATVLDKFPSLSVTATTDGGHVSGSYHYKGEAVDISGDSGTMHSAADWIHANLINYLTEGIHNPNLAVKFGKDVGAGFYASVWAGHANHIHIATADGVITKPY